MNINPNIKSGWNQAHQPKSVEYYYHGIVSQDRFILSEAISLVESNLHRYSKLVIELLDKCYHTPSSTLRIGITGSPGVGKSSFIERMGMYMIEEKKQHVAVLAIDPSSTITNGSILGDKTRMPHLSTHKNAFIRPSPSESYLGGVSSATKEIIILCEAAGYDVIMIETVGVGQSETMVADIVDMFLLLILPGAGDEIQGIKRGIVEMSDMVIVNKSDGDNIPLSKIMQQNYKNAIHLFQAKEHGNIVNVRRCSSTLGIGIKEIWDNMDEFHAKVLNGFLPKNRANQDRKWLDTSVLITMERHILSQQVYKERLNTLKKKMENKMISPFDANAQFAESLKND